MTHLPGPNHRNRPPSGNPRRFGYPDSWLESRFRRGGDENAEVAARLDRIEAAIAALAEEVAEALTLRGQPS